MSKELYTERVAVVGGRDGTARSEDGKLDLALALPTAIGGSGKGTNPEQLFAAGFGACFTSSLFVAARSRKLDPGAIAVDAEVTLVLDETSGDYGIKAELAVRLPKLSDGDAEWVIAEARRICAYSNALKGTAEVCVFRH